MNRNKAANGHAGVGMHVRHEQMRLSSCLLAVACAAAVLAVACTGGNNRKATGGTAVTTAAATVAAPSPAAAGSAANSGTSLAGAASPPVAASTPEQSPSRVETVKEAYDLLLDRYYKPLKSSDLLTSAWKGATQATKGGGQVDAPKLSGDRNADWQAFSAQYQQLFDKSGGSVQGPALAFGAIDAMAVGLHDDHTYFLNSEENKRRQAADSGGEQFVGVGITIGNRAPFVVQEVQVGGPADRGGVKSGDAITAIDGADASNFSVQDISNKLRGGQAGSTVTVTVKRSDGSTQNLTLTRAQIVQPAIESKLMPDGTGYIALHNFSDAYARFPDGRNIAEELDAALQSFEQSGVKGWVFDVRGNPGGSEQTLAEVAGRFLPDGIVVASVDRDGHTTEAPADGHLFSIQRPLAVLIDGQSGSASELFAATMKEYGRARLVGQRTAGAVNGAEETELPDGAAIQYTVIQGLTGKLRKVLDGAGVSPDDTVGGGGSPSAVLAGRSDAQFDAARQWVLDQAKKQPTLALKPPPPAGTLSAAAVRAQLEPLAATIDDVPPGAARAKYGYLVTTYPNDLAIGNAVDATNAAAYEQKVRDRHWLGGFQQFFGSGAPPPYVVQVDLYKDDSGARDAVRTNDFPNGLKQATLPAHLGDDANAYNGYDAAEGISQIVWRRGKVVFTVLDAAEPGRSGMDQALALARKLDERAAQAGQ